MVVDNDKSFIVSGILLTHPFFFAPQQVLLMFVCFFLIHVKPGKSFIFSGLQLHSWLTYIRKKT